MSRSKSPKKKTKMPNLKFGPPPKKEYCLICDRITKWVYNRNIGHGCCIDCGSTSLYSGYDKEAVLKKLKLKETGFNFLGLDHD